MQIKSSLYVFTTKKARQLLPFLFLSFFVIFIKESSSFHFVFLLLILCFWKLNERLVGFSISILEGE